MSRARYQELDILRGLAIVMMIVFHLLYDLNFHHFIQIALFQNPFWLVYRECILFLFLGLSGGCLYLVHQQGINWRAFGKRTVRVLGAALLVTVATYVYIKEDVVLFGILHCIAVSSLITLGFLRHPKQALIVGLLLLAFGFIGDLNLRQNFVPYLVWLGFGSLSIRSFDVVPLIPYLGYSLIGLFLMAQALNTKREYLFIRLDENSRLNRSLAFLGRHPLLIYLVHQPILVGIVYLMEQGR